MADNDKTQEGTSDDEARRTRVNPAHDPFGRVDVSQEPGQAPRNRVNAKDFGFVSEELTWPEDPSQPGVSSAPQPKGEDQG